MMARFGSLLYTLLVLLIAGLLGFLSTRFGFERDWSHAQSASLSPASLSLLAQLDGPVEVVSYARTQGGLREVVANFVERFHRAKPDLSLRFVDPDADPAAMRAAGVSLDGELDLRFQGRSERLKVLGETEFSSALLRLSRARQRIVAELVPDALAWQAVAAIGWLLAFLPWVLRSTWIYLTPRADGKPG